MLKPKGLLALCLAAFILTAVPSACKDSESATVNVAPETTPDASDNLNTPGEVSINIITSQPSIEPAETPNPASHSPAPTESTTPTATPPPVITISDLNYIPAYVNADGVNLRIQPSTDAKVLRIFNKGVEVLITGKTDDWYRIVTDDVEGFIAKEFLIIGYLTTPTPKPPSMYAANPGNFSQSDIKLVAALIHIEGKGSSYIGYRALASIVYNRVMNKSGNFPNTVEGVILQAGQFGYSKDYLISVKPNSTAMAAAEYVFQKHGSTLPKKVLFYRAASLGIEWTSYTRYYATIDGNNYYYGINF